MTGVNKEKETRAGEPVHKAFDENEYQNKIADAALKIHNERSLRMAYQYISNLIR